jgi:hypothetical protein
LNVLKRYSCAYVYVYVCAQLQMFAVFSEFLTALDKNKGEICVRCYSKLSRCKLIQAW